MEEFPPNSKKSKDAKPDKKIEKVVEGPVIGRKPSFVQKIKGVFIGGEAKTALSYIGYEVMLPALRNMVVEAATKGIERMIYGESQPRRQGYTGGSRVQYNSPVQRYGMRQNTPYNSPGAARSRRSNDYEPMELIFASRDEADTVLDTMLNIVDQYEMVSVADLHELAGLPANHTDNKWGWVSLRGTSVRQIRGGYIIDLPPVEPL